MIVTVTLNPSLDRTLTVSRIVPNQVLRAAESCLDWGGKGLNVSRALKALGADSTVTGLLGGWTGVQLEQGLRQMGIVTDFVTIFGETRTNTVVVARDGEEYVKVNEVGPAVQGAELDEFLDHCRALIQPGDLWVLSGGLPPGAPLDVYAHLVTIVHSKGGKAFLDASGQPLRLGCASAPFLVKPNIDEAGELLGREIATEHDAQDAVNLCLSCGVELVALSMGARGLLLANGEISVQAIPPPVQVRVPVGTGDALLAGVIWALQLERPLEDVARWGVAAGTAAAMKWGTGVGTRTEVEAVYGQTRVHQISD